MSEQPVPGAAGNQPENRTPEGPRGESIVWSIISTLVAGPAVWGGIGWAVDAWQQSGRIFTAGGVVIGFVTSLYLVYVKYGKV